MKNIVLFGCGSGLDLFLLTYKDCLPGKLVAIVDNSAFELNSMHGYPLMLPEKLPELDYDEIIITSRHYVEIHEQLLMAGVKREHISIFPGLVVQ